MKLSELKTRFYDQLSGCYPSEELQSFFSLLSESFLNYTRLDTVVKGDEMVSEATLKKFQNAIARLHHYEPIQYILAETTFYGLSFKVNKHTLIPRPETEELVAWILKDLQAAQSSADESWRPSILDIGTGTGCIAIAIAKNFRNALVSALDISAEALRTAQSNAAMNAVDVTFFKKDILSTDTLLQQYDVIVSNPPYVRELEKEMMQANVLQYEPEGALFVSNDDPLLFYRRIGLLAITHLSSGGHLYFEINEYLGEALSTMLQYLGYSSIEIRKDLFGKNRMLRCSL